MKRVIEIVDSSSEEEPLVIPDFEKTNKNIHEWVQSGFSPTLQKQKFKKVSFGSSSSSNENEEEIPLPLATIPIVDISDPNKKFNDALVHYYRLKADYENSYKSLIKQLTENSKLSLSEKRSRIKKQCINCDFEAHGRNEGTIFSIIPKTDDQDPLKSYRILSAKCGNPDQETKCDLDIELNVGRFCLLPQTLQDLTEEKKEIENNNIVVTNKKKFGYINEEESLRILPVLTSITESNSDSLTSLSEIYNSKKEAQKSKLGSQTLLNDDDRELTERMTYDFLNGFRKRMELYHQSREQTPEQLRALMLEYKTNFADRKKSLIDTKYKNFALLVSDNETITVRNLGIPIQDLDIAYEVSTSIIKDKFGTVNKGKKKKKGKKKGKKGSIEEVAEIKNPYKILGIKRTASAIEITRAYKTMANKYNPKLPANDKIKNKAKRAEIEATFIDVTNAFQQLNDPVSRDYYDKNGSYMARGGGIMMNPYTLYDMYFDEPTF